MKIMKMTQKFSFDKSTVRLGDSSRFLSDCLAPGLSDRVRRMESSNETFQLIFTHCELCRVLKLAYVRRVGQKVQVFSSSFATSKSFSAHPKVIAFSGRSKLLLMPHFIPNGNQKRNQYALAPRAQNLNPDLMHNMYQIFKVLILSVLLLCCELRVQTLAGVYFILRSFLQENNDTFFIENSISLL